MTENNKLVRTFATGATRDLDENKPDYEGFLSPLALDAFAAYMSRKRKMADGSLRDSDNWQKGIPLDAYMKSGYRHLMDWWKHHRGLDDITVEDLEDTLCALLFNVQGYLHEVVKAKRGTVVEPSAPPSRTTKLQPVDRPVKVGDVVEMVETFPSDYPPNGSRGKVLSITPTPHTTAGLTLVRVEWDKNVATPQLVDDVFAFRIRPLEYVSN